MKNRHIFRYFFKNAVYSLLFWIAAFLVVYEFLDTFVLKLEKLNERTIMEQLYSNLYLMGLFLAPALGIIAGRVLVAKESQALLCHQLSRRTFYFGSFLFHGMLLSAVWLVFVVIYILLMKNYNQPITSMLLFKLGLTIFTILLPFFWTGFLSVNMKTAAVVIIYIVVFLAFPRVVTQLDRPSATPSQQTAAVAIKALTVAVPQTGPFQTMVSPFSGTTKAATQKSLVNWLGYGLLWSAFLLMSGFLIYRRKDLVDPHR